MRLTATQQRNAVSEGAALGLLMCGRDELPADKIAVDLSFAAAWRNWSYRTRFPQVNTDLGKGFDGLRALTRAGERKRTWNLYWESSGVTVAVHARPQWHGGEIDAEIAAGSIDGDVPAPGWRDLAAEFLARLER